MDIALYKVCIHIGLLVHRNGYNSIAKGVFGDIGFYCYDRRLGSDDRTIVTVKTDKK